MANSPSPPYPLSISISRSRTRPDDIRSVADAMLRSSLSRNPSSTSSAAATLAPDPNTPYSHPKERARCRKLSTSSKGDKGPTNIHPSGSVSSSMSPSTLSTTSRTRERLRLAELECDELRRAVEKERVVAERLKYEGRVPEMSATEAQLHVQQLKRDIRAAGAKSSRRSTAGLFKEACSTDLLFLIDTTSSMTQHIQAAKDQVVSIVNNIEVAFLNQAEVRMAVVGYKDHQDTPNIQFLDFTPSTNRVRSFVGELTATGGDDEPEDVLGGISQALNASWTHQTRCIMHIADAPPHGRTLQDPSCRYDSYPNPGSEPHSLTYKPLLKQMIRLHINYALLRINASTDCMAFKFFQVYAKASSDCTLHKSNRHYSIACNMSADFRNGFRGGITSKRNAKAGLLFREAELGTAYSALQHLVVKVVTTSASRTAVRVSASTTRTRNAGTHNKLDTSLAAVDENGDDADDTSLETIPPQWNTPGWLNETLMVEGFSPDGVVHGASTLNDMMANDDNIKMSITELTIHKRSRPFAQGATRVASYARTAASTNRFVVKSFKRDGKRLAHVAEDMQCQTLCKAFALEFNALSAEKHSIDFIVTTCLKGKSGMDSGNECMSLEPFIEGSYIKYNGNSGYVNESSPDDRFNQAAQAFSHFTFERSRGQFLVCDLQGVGHVLTDPAVHTLNPERFKLTDTNLGTEGFKFFFCTHECNDICRKLRLESTASMIISGPYHFRTTWPSMENTVCCSNKLCGRIVPLALVDHSDEFPGYHWCNACWPQLYSSTVQRICISPGPEHHDFEASDFFYESQGQRTPRECPSHRGSGGMLVPRTPVVPGGSLWSRLKFAATVNNNRSTAEKESTTRKLRKRHSSDRSAAPDSRPLERSSGPQVSSDIYRKK